MIALDTSFLLAAEGRDEARKWRLATRVLGALDAGEIVVPAQALAEMLHVLKTFHAVTETESAAIAARWLAAARSAGISRMAIETAQDLAESADLALEDALIVAAAEEVGATVLLSDEIADGLRYGGLVVANPFQTASRSRLDRMLGPEWSAGI